MTCTATKPNGERCRAQPKPGQTLCRWHDPSPEARAKHIEESRRGGENRNLGYASAEAMASDLPTDTDLATAAGAKVLMGIALARLAALPFTEKTAHALAALIGPLTKVIETSEIEERLDRLEQEHAAPRSPRLGIMR